MKDLRHMGQSTVLSEIYLCVRFIDRNLDEVSSYISATYLVTMQMVPNTSNYDNPHRIQNEIPTPRHATKTYSRLRPNRDF